jgi:hypothetical protein
VSPDTTINTWNAFGIYGVDIWWHPQPEIKIKTWDTYEILSGTDTLVTVLNYGDNIANNSNGIWARHRYSCLNCDGAIGNWTGVKDKYVGFRYKDTLNQFYYGWIKLDVAADASSFTVKVFAVSMMPSRTLIAGQLFSTGIEHGDRLVNITPVIKDKVIRLDGLDRSAEVIVVDMAGRQVMQLKIKPDESLDMRQYASGVYSLCVNYGVNRIIFKISLP